MAAMTAARAAKGLERRYRMLRNRGGEVKCPVCGHRFARFKDDWNRPNAICWRCGAHERHRALALYLDRHPELFAGATSLLHFAPEWGIARRARAIPGIRYVTADLDPRGVDLQLDITRIALADEAFDAIICSHVLEHVEDDRAAIGELFRVLTPGGWAIVMVPLDLGRSVTHEDPAIRTPEDRRREYLQHDHVRLYALDIADRLAAAGFTVTSERLTEELSASEVELYRLLEVDVVFLCRKPG
jgi:SAM-dependent methyltransferase